MSHQTSSFATNKFYEAERSTGKITAGDFASEQQFDYLKETDDLNDFLLSKSWDKYFKQPGPYAQRRCETSIANMIFENVLNQFRFRMDTVQIFHIITDFYDVDAKWYFERLVQKYRTQLQSDLEHRIGKLKQTTNTKIGEDKIRLTFASLFASSK